MTRKEEIRTAVDTIVPILPSNNGRTYEQALIASGFEEGVKWADANPKSPWICVDEDLPCNHEELLEDYNYETVAVIVKYRYSNSPSSDYMRLDKGNWVWVRNCGITHWMPIPKLP